MAESKEIQSRKRKIEIDEETEKEEENPVKKINFENKQPQLLDLGKRFLFTISYKIKLKMSRGYS